MKQVTEKTKGVITLREKLSRFFAAFTLDTALQSLETYIFYFYTDILGLSAKLSGTIGLISTLWDAINDPLVGTYVDNRTCKSGEKGRPYIKYAALPLCVFLVLMFVAPQMSMGMKFAYALLIRVLYDVCYTFLSIGSQILFFRSTPLREDRVSMGQFSTVGSLLGIAASSVALWPLIKLFGSIGGVRNEARGFLGAIFCFSVLLFAGLMFLYFSGKERVKPLVVSDESNKSSIFTCLKIFITHKNWCLVTLFQALVFTCNTLVLTVLTYYCKYVLGDASYMMIVMIAFLGGGIFIAPFAKVVSRRFGLKGICIACASAFILSKLFFISLPASQVTILLCAFFHGAGFGARGTASGAMNASLSEIMEVRAGRRVDGMIVSIGNLFSKGAQALIVFLIGLALSASGYDGMLAVQPESAIATIEACIGWVGMVVAVFTLSVSLFLTLEDESGRLRTNA